MSPYGQSVFADAVDAVQAVDLTFDALVNEVDVSKVRAFLPDVLFDRGKTGDKTISIPFGKSNCTVFLRVMSTEDTIQEFAPALRTASQSEAFRIALQMLGDRASCHGRVAWVWCEHPRRGVMRVQYDVSIMQDVAAEKQQDMHEVIVTTAAWEYRVKRYGEDEKTAEARVRELGVISKGQMPSG